jgi:hypothetical protein
LLLELPSGWQPRQRLVVNPADMAQLDFDLEPTPSVIPKTGMSLDELKAERKALGQCERCGDTLRMTAFGLAPCEWCAR